MDKSFNTRFLCRHLQIAATNGLEMAECILKNNDITKFDIIPVGGAIFPTMSFFNHSCYPNATRLGFQNHQVATELEHFMFYTNDMKSLSTSSKP